VIDVIKLFFISIFYYFLFFCKICGAGVINLKIFFAFEQGERFTEIESRPLLFQLS